jgi:hypothetical protein
MAELAGTSMAQLRIGARIIAAELRGQAQSRFRPAVDLSAGLQCRGKMSGCGAPGSRPLASAFVEELSKRDCSRARNISGTGGATVDPHFSLPRIGRSRRQLLQEDTPPFVKPSIKRT